MFFPRSSRPGFRNLRERFNHPPSSCARLDYFIKASICDGIGGVAYARPVVLKKVRLLRKFDLCRTLGTHDCNLRRWPGKIDICAKLLASHRHMRAAIGFSKHNRNLRHGGLSICIYEFRALGYHACVLLLGSAEETRDIDKSDNRDIEGITEADKASSLARCVTIQDTCENLRLICDNADRTAIHPGKARNHVPCPALMYLKEATVISHTRDDIVHIIWFLRILRHDGIQRVIVSVCRVLSLHSRRLLTIV